MRVTILFEDEPCAAQEQEDTLTFRACIHAACSGDAQQHRE
jgi:hypothetical protein